MIETCLQMQSENSILYSYKSQYRNFTTRSGVTFTFYATLLNMRFKFKNKTSIKL